MVRHRLFTYLFLSLALVLSLSLVDFVSADGQIKNKAIHIVPDRDISYETTEITKWKATWDQARFLSRQKKFEHALSSFELLLANKPSLDEARWEYTSVLLHLHRWKQAGRELDLLLFNAPDNRKYLLAQAKVALETGELLFSVRLFSQIYATAPAEQDAEQALSGLIRALEAQNDVFHLLPLSEQLLLLQPKNLKLKKSIGLLGASQGENERALELLHQVIAVSPQDPLVLKALAQLSKTKGEYEDAAFYREVLSRVVPNDVETHFELAAYYRLKNKSDLELKHLEICHRIKPDDVTLFVRLADLYMETDRTDLALKYYNAYLTSYPGNEAVRSKKTKALSTLAVDLLALVENSGSELLWQDLMEITSSRIEVYLFMADILRKQKKYKELTDVLLVIAEELPNDLALRRELAFLLEQQERTQGFWD